MRKDKDTGVANCCCFYRIEIEIVRVFVEMKEKSASLLSYKRQACSLDRINSMFFYYIESKKGDPLIDFINPSEKTDFLPQ